MVEVPGGPRCRGGGLRNTVGDSTVFGPIETLGSREFPDSESMEAPTSGDKRILCVTESEVDSVDSVGVGARVGERKAVAAGEGGLEGGDAERFRAGTGGRGEILGADLGEGIGGGITETVGGSSLVDEEGTAGVEEGLESPERGGGGVGVGSCISEIEGRVGESSDRGGTGSTEAFSSCLLSLFSLLSFESFGGIFSFDGSFFRGIGERDTRDIISGIFDSDLTRR